MENSSSRIREEANHLLRSGRDYLETLYELTLVRVIRKGSNWGALMLIRGIMVVLVLFLFFFLSIATAICLGSWLESYFLGFLMMGLFYALLLILFLLTCRKLWLPFFRDRIIQNIFKDEQEDKKLSGSGA